MKSVLCYGDSNTFGLIPGQSLNRYTYPDRWPSALQSRLGPDWLVIAEGLSGRTTCRDDPIDGAHLNGRTYLRPCLESHNPVTTLIIMLGTNDLKERFQTTAHDIGKGMAVLVEDTRKIAIRSGFNAPKIILVSPPTILRKLPNREQVFVGGYEKSQQLSHEYKSVAKEKGIGFLDASDHAKCSPIDGLHIDSFEAKRLGEAMGNFILSRS